VKETFYAETHRVARITKYVILMTCEYFEVESTT